jgi:hypothetical protein
MLITGLHTVVDIFCTCCSANLGWKYVRVENSGSLFAWRSPNAPRGANLHASHLPPLSKPHTKTTPPQEHAFEETQKYKEGKFIVETARVLKQGW